MATKQDEIVEKLYAKLKLKKDEIAKIEKPTWKTNCSFSYTEGSSSRINLQVVSDTKDLTRMLAYLIGQMKNFEEANSRMGRSEKFDWMGFSFEEWEADILTRLGKIEIAKKKAEFKEIDERLNKLISPEKRAEIELADLEKLLG